MLNALLLVAVGVFGSVSLGIAHAGEPRIYTAKEVISEMFHSGKTVVAGRGFTWNEYEDPNKAIMAVGGDLERLILSNPNDMESANPDLAKGFIVTSGLAPSKFGEMYFFIAKKMGFETRAIVSKAAWPKIQERMVDGKIKNVDHFYVVEDSSLGGYGGKGKLSPTSKALVESAVIFNVYGGGKIENDEAMEAIKQKKIRNIRLLERSHSLVLKENPNAKHFFGEVQAAYQYDQKVKYPQLYEWPTNSNESSSESEKETKKASVGKTLNPDKVIKMRASDLAPKNAKMIHRMKARARRAL